MWKTQKREKYEEEVQLVETQIMKWNFLCSFFYYRLMLNSDRKKLNNRLTSYLFNFKADLLLTQICFSAVI